MKNTTTPGVMSGKMRGFWSRDWRIIKIWLSQLNCETSGFTTEGRCHVEPETTTDNHRQPQTWKLLHFVSRVPNIPINEVRSFHLGFNKHPDSKSNLLQRQLLRRKPPTCSSVLTQSQFLCTRAGARLGLCTFRCNQARFHSPLIPTSDGGEIYFPLHLNWPPDVSLPCLATGSCEREGRTELSFNNNRSRNSRNVLVPDVSAAFFLTDVFFQQLSVVLQMLKHPRIWELKPGGPCESGRTLLRWCLHHSRRKDLFPNG